MGWGVRSFLSVSPCVLGACPRAGRGCQCLVRMHLMDSEICACFMSCGWVIPQQLRWVPLVVARGNNVGVHEQQVPATMREAVLYERRAACIGARDLSELCMLVELTHRARFSRVCVWGGCGCMCARRVRKVAFAEGWGSSMAVQSREAPHTQHTQPAFYWQVPS